MIIEVLYPEICCLYGDMGNIRYVKQSLIKAQVINTCLNDEPYFVKNEPDLIYMGTSTENSQLLAQNKLMPYRERIKELIEKGKVFLITGNALEIFGCGVSEDGKNVLSGLGILDITTKRDMMNRKNSLYLGKFNNMDIVGYKSQFTFSYYGKEEIKPLFETVKGYGFNPQTNKEGVRINNFLATYVIGPLFILSPPFMRYVLELAGESNFSLAFENEAMDAYNQRLSEYKSPKTGFYY